MSLEGEFGTRIVHPFLTEARNTTGLQFRERPALGEVAKEVIADANIKRFGATRKPLFLHHQEAGEAPIPAADLSTVRDRLVQLGTLQ